MHRTKKPNEEGPSSLDRTFFGYFFTGPTYDKNACIFISHTPLPLPPWPSDIRLAEKKCGYFFGGVKRRSKRGKIGTPICADLGVKYARHRSQVNAHVCSSFFQKCNFFWWECYCSCSCSCSQTTPPIYIILGNFTFVSKENKHVSFACRITIWVVSFLGGILNDGCFRICVLFHLSF